MAAYFCLNGGDIGKDCCLYPARADPFMPEPDLVHMGGRCILDCASVVCHLNTRGAFMLKEITLEKDTTLHCCSRVQEAVHVKEGAQLLEKSLAMTGEVIEANSGWKDAPAAFWFQYDMDMEEQVYNKTSRLLPSGSSRANSMASCFLVPVQHGYGGTSLQRDIQTLA
jgi:hypothetical protein